MEPASTKFTKHESDGKHLVQQHSNLIDGHSLLWTRGYVVPEAVDFAESDRVIERMNAENYAGFSDWRKPTPQERFLLSDLTKVPAIDTEYFEGERYGYEWTSMVSASSPSDCAGCVYFGSGDSGYYAQYYECFVRAVRSSQ
jgi:hypothetical protein